MDPLSRTILLGSSSEVKSYWIATLDGTGGEYGYGVAVDGSGNAYVVGYTDSQGAGGYDLLIAKYNSFGTIQWQRSLGGAGTEAGQGIAVDGSGNAYVVGYTDSQGAGFDDLLIAKYNSSGTIQWQRSLGGTGNDYGYGVAVDGSGNVYVTGYTNSEGVEGSYDVLIAKYNSSGAIQWQRSLGGSGIDQGSGIAVDSSGNVYVVSTVNSEGAGLDDLVIAKYNASGTIQWQRSLGGTGTDEGYGVAVDSSGNVYVTGRTNSQGAGGSDLLIAKYNSSGAIQWQRSLGGTGTDFACGVAVDGSGNVYVTGYTDSQGAGGYDLLIAKYNSSGTIQWQRSLGGTSSEVGYGIAVAGSGNVYVVGYTGDAEVKILVAKLPDDGTLTGTYGDLTYAARTLTDASRTLTDSARTLTDASRTLTDAARTLTDAATTLTSSTTPVS